jgi:hypothetical protein
MELRLRIDIMKITELKEGLYYYTTRLVCHEYTLKKLNFNGERKNEKK